MELFVCTLSVYTSVVSVVAYSLQDADEATRNVGRLGTDCSQFHINERCGVVSPLSQYN